MKTNYRRIMEAWDALNQISNVRRGPATSRKLFGLRLALDPSVTFFMEEEQKLVEELGGKAEMNGLVSFDDQRVADECRKRRDELLNMEEKINIEKIVIHDSEISEVSSQEMWMLRDFVDWVE